MESYVPHEREKHWRSFWEKKKIYAFKPAKGQRVYSIDTPPPNVSGRMHMGHAFTYPQGDFIARYHRMKGEAVFYPFGTDDNGLPTERLVERVNNVRGPQMSRAAFVKLCNQTLKKMLPEFVEDWKLLGVSCDFSQPYSTIDARSIRTSQASFIELYRQGRVYAEEAPVAWCVECQTAIAQAEFEDKEKASTFNTIAFGFKDKELLIATTRPELLGACVALVCHPEDERYKRFVGKFASVPLFTYEVPIIADEKADPSKGTGLLMCCTFGDKTDVEWWRMHKLPLKVVLTKDGRMSAEAGRYAGMTLEACRKKILDDLQTAGFLKEQKPITHVANVHERCGTPIELLKTPQWFIRVLDQKEAFIEAADRITWYPSFMKQRYVHWVENLQWDWCISRQRHFGVPFPVWHCTRCKGVVLADLKELPVDPLQTKPSKKCSCGSRELVGEADVMDTWATSSLTPQIALRWVEKPEAFLKQYPMTLRLQAHDIIRTWTFYTIVKGLYHHGKAPWNVIMMSGYVQDPYGKKMSKSKGNVISPQDVRQKYCSDAIRWGGGGMKIGEDTPFQEKEVVAGQRLVVKLWNASKFLSSHLQGFDGKRPKKLMVMDKWVLGRLAGVVKRCTQALDEYRYDVVRQEIDLFFWHDFCDNYLEIVKHRLYEGAGAERESGVYSTATTLWTVITLLAPFVPFITEEIYHLYFKRLEKKKSVHLCPWPKDSEQAVDPALEEIGQQFVHLLGMVRKEKTKLGKGMGTPIVLTVHEKDWELLKECRDDFQAVCRAKEVRFGEFAVSL